MFSLFRRREFKELDEVKILLIEHDKRMVEAGYRDSRHPTTLRWEKEIA